MGKSKYWFEMHCKRCGTFGVTPRGKKLGVSKCRKNDPECPSLHKKHKL